MAKQSTKTNAAAALKSQNEARAKLNIELDAMLKLSVAVVTTEGAAVSARYTAGLAYARFLAAHDGDEKAIDEMREHVRCGYVVGKDGVTYAAAATRLQSTEDVWYGAAKNHLAKVAMASGYAKIAIEKGMNDADALKFIADAVNAKAAAGKGNGKGAGKRKEETASPAAQTVNANQAARQANAAPQPKDVKVTIPHCDSSVTMYQNLDAAFMMALEIERGNGEYFTKDRGEMAREILSMIRVYNRRWNAK